LIEKNDWTDGAEDADEAQPESADDKKAVNDTVRSPGKKTERKKTRKKNKPKRPRKPKKYKKLTALKENNMLTAKYILIPAVIWYLLFAALIWYVSTDASNLKEIENSGNEMITEEEIESRLDFSAGDKMYGIDTGTAEENISLLP